MKDGKPETLEEALRLIEEQNRRLSEKENQLNQKESQLKQNSILLEQKYKELDEANKEILEKIAEIKLLNEKLVVKRAREWVARTEAMTKLLKDQPLLFDAEELGIKIENPCPSPSDEEISQAETDEDSSSEEKKTKKSGKGRKSVSTINNLAKARVVIDLTDEEKICPNCGSQMKKVYTVTSERLVHIPAREYIEVVIRNVYECQNCLDENDRPVTKAAQDKQIIGRSIATPSLLAHVFMGKSPEDYLRCLFEKSPYAETEEDWEKLLPWNIEITPFQFRGEWMDLVKQG